MQSKLIAISFSFPHSILHWYRLPEDKVYEHNECSNMRKARRHMDLLRVVYEYVLIVYTLYTWSDRFRTSSDQLSTQRTYTHELL